MDPRPTLHRPSLLVTAVASTLGTLIAATLLAAVTGLFQSRGLPLEEIALAERACAVHAYVSERDTCIKERIAAERGQHVARK